MLRQAMILCGGLGTRLGALTATTPKPLLPVAGRPFLDVLLGQLARHGVEEAVLLASFLSAQVTSYAEAYKSSAQGRGIELHVVTEPELAGTGGALFNALTYADTQFLLLNGDSWFDVDLSALAARLTGPTQAVLAVRAVADAARYGVVTMREDRVINFLDRPPRSGPGLVNGGVYAMSREIAGALSPRCSLEQTVLPRLATEGLVAGVVSDGFFIDIGVPREYELAQTVVPDKLKQGTK